MRPAENICGDGKKRHDTEQKRRIKEKSMENKYFMKLNNGNYEDNRHNHNNNHDHNKKNHNQQQ
jgi:hypothetical protein